MSSDREPGRVDPETSRDPNQPYDFVESRPGERANARFRQLFKAESREIRVEKQLEDALIVLRRHRRGGET